jgi:PHD/YefM family antitoxin component YafN of YafNO toxin-antitoxin module
MLSIKERFLVDENDHRIGVLLDMEDYEHILEELEELESIRAFDEARASGEKPIPFEQALKEIEQQRKK